MNRSDALRTLDNIFNLDISSREVNVCLASLDIETDEVQFQRIPVTDKLASDFGQIVDDVLKKLRDDSRDGNLTLHSYSAVTKLDSHEIEYLDLEPHESIRHQIALLSSLAHLPDFKQEQKFIEGLLFYVIVVKPPNGELFYVFRAFSQKRELARSRWFAMVMGKGAFDHFSDPLYLFDSNVDCFSRGDCMFIIKKPNFHRIFRFLEMLMETAEETLEVIKSRIPIDNFTEFAQACKDHLQKAAKLKNIASKPYLKKITMKDIKKVIDRYHLLTQVVKVNGQEKLQFDPSDKWAILRLLDDDYLESVMTKLRYETTSKRRIENAKIKKDIA